MFMLITYITCFAIYLGTQQCINFHFRGNIPSFMTENNSSRFFLDAWYLRSNSKPSRLAPTMPNTSAKSHTTPTHSQTRWYSAELPESPASGPYLNDDCQPPTDGIRADEKNPALVGVSVLSELSRAVILLEKRQQNKGR